MTVGYKTLLVLNQRLKDAAKQTRVKKKAKVSAKIALPDAGPSEEPAHQSFTPTIESSLETLTLQQNLPQAYVSLVTEPPSELPNHCMLYKAKAAAQMGDWISEENGSLSLTGLVTHPGGDFNSDQLAYYWTPDRATAIQYRDWASVRCPHSEIWLIQCQVRTSYVESLRSKELWFGCNWKEFVWYCRKGADPPSRYRDFCQPNVDLVKGHVFKNSSSVIVTRIKRENVQDSINESNLVVNPDGRKATQWAILNRASMRRFDEEIKGKIHVEVLQPPLQPKQWAS